MSYTNYENNFIPAETERFSAQDISLIEETAILLVTKTLAEANAEEILDIVLSKTFDHVCPQITEHLPAPLCDKMYDQPLAATSPNLTNILSVLEMESSHPVQQKTKITCHSDHKSESGDESQEEPVFTSPIYVKSGPENINIVEESSLTENCDEYDRTPDLQQRSQDCKKTTDIAYEAPKNIVEHEGSLSEEKDNILCVDLDSRVVLACDKKETENSENIGDANDTINTADTIEPTSSIAEQKVALAGKIIGDVVPDYNSSYEEHFQPLPQVVQAYVLYPGGPAKAEDQIVSNNENPLATEMGEDAFPPNNLTKDENPSSSSNEEKVEESLVGDEVGDLLNYFEGVSNTVDMRVRIVDDSSNEGIVNVTICEEVKRAVKEIAAAVFEGQGDGTSTELSNLSIQLANHQEQNTSEVQAISPDQPLSTGQFFSNQKGPEEEITPQVQDNSPDQQPSTDQCYSNQNGPGQSQCTSNSDQEKVIAIHETLSDDSGLENFFSGMHKQDELEEREVQVILRDQESDSESVTEATFLSNYIATSGLDTNGELDGFSYQSGSNINLSLKKSYLDTSKLTQVVEEFYSLKKMAENMEKMNPNIKANLTIGKVGSSRRALGPIKNDEPFEEIWDEDNTEDIRENKAKLQNRSRWQRVRDLLSCFNRNRQSSDEP